MLDAVVFSIPDLLKPAARKCLVAVLDEDVRRCNGYTVFLIDSQ